jgi:hypothetical protein
MLWNGNKCGKKIGNGNLKATFLNTDCYRLKTTGECGIFQPYG